MKLLPLSPARAQIRCGTPLAFNVRDDAGNLLLAKGQVLATQDMVDTLLNRGAFVDAEEVHSRASADSGRATDTVFDRWTGLEARLTTLLRNPTDEQFRSKVEELALSIYKLVSRHTDPLIFAIMRHEHHTRYASYGISHSLHAATVCALVGLRMNLRPAQCASLVCAALTMNVSVVDLQGILACRGGRLNAKQDATIKAHPTESVRLLQAAGVSDADWLEAVQNHHERPDGTGYPQQLRDPSALSQILRLVDVFTAKHASRAGRAPMAPRQAAQELYVQNKDQLAAAVLIKEFGMFPAGCFVKLANGETAVVVRRGAQANAPFVAAVLNRNGDAIASPIRRDTSQAEFAISTSLPDTAVMVTLSPEKLYGKLDI
jgi:HD-GYP domain-containing protein (c-di-GMP phosphodiesterase class II)